MKLNADTLFSLAFYILAVLSIIIGIYSLLAPHPPKMVEFYAYFWPSLLIAVALFSMRLKDKAWALIVLGGFHFIYIFLCMSELEWWTI